MTLQTTLNRLYDSRSVHHLANDPLSFCHRFTQPEDQEIAGLIASSLAYGNIRIIMGSLERIFSFVGPSPRRFVENFNPAEGLRIFAGFKHRFNDGRDLTALCLAIQTMIRESGSIGAFFTALHDPASSDLTPALTRFSSAILAFNYSPVYGTGRIPDDAYFPFFFPSPAAGSACKRLCLYLRWMVRPADGFDLGLWNGISPSRLVIPVDRHIQRISQLIGLTARKQADWKMALEITSALRRFDPLDPVRYDFSLAHLGITEGCSGTDQPSCSSCPISGFCKRV